jgi:hypothetical protein
VPLTNCLASRPNLCESAAAGRGESIGLWRKHSAHHRRSWPVNRDRGASRDAAAPTSPCVRVRTRRFGGFSIGECVHEDEPFFGERLIAQRTVKRLGSAQALALAREITPAKYVIKSKKREGDPTTIPSRAMNKGNAHL